MQLNINAFKCVVTSKEVNEYQRKDGTKGISRKLTIVDDGNSMLEISVPDNEDLIERFNGVETMHPYIVSFSLDDKYSNIRVILSQIFDDETHPLYAYYKKIKK